MWATTRCRPRAARSRCSAGPQGRSSRRGTNRADPDRGPGPDVVRPLEDTVEWPTTAVTRPTSDGSAGAVALEVSDREAADSPSATAAADVSIAPASTPGVTASPSIARFGSAAGSGAAVLSAEVVASLSGPTVAGGTTVSTSGWIPSVTGATTGTTGSTTGATTGPTGSSTGATQGRLDRRPV